MSLIWFQLAAILSVNPALLNFAGGVVGGNPLWTTNSPTTSLQPTSSSSIPPSTVQPSQKQHQQHPLASQTAPAGAVSQLSQLLLQAAMMQQQPPAAPAVPGLGGPVSTSSIISGAVYGAAAPPTTSTSVAAAPYVVPQDINSTMAFDSSMSYMQPMVSPDTSCCAALLTRRVEAWISHETCQPHYTLISSGVHPAFIITTCLSRHTSNSDGFFS